MGEGGREEENEVSGNCTANGLNKGQRERERKGGADPQIWELRFCESSFLSSEFVNYQTSVAEIYFSKLESGIALFVTFRNGARGDQKGALVTARNA